MRDKLDIEKVKRLFYDESNGFGDIKLKNAHDKFVDATAALMATRGIAGRTTDEDITDYEHITELLENYMKNFADSRGIKKFYLAAQKVGLIDDLSDFNLDAPDEETDMDAYLCDALDCAKFLAQHLYGQMEEKAETIGLGTGKA